MARTFTLVSAAILSMASPAQAKMPTHVELGNFAIMAHDNETALIQYSLAATAGDPVAQHALGHMYEYGIGTPIDLKAAFNWYQRAANQGSALGQTALAGMYQFGIGVPKNDAEAMRFYRKAADQGYAIAQYNLANSYDSIAIPHDYSEAYKWYALAAAQKTVGALRQRIFDEALAATAAKLTPAQRRAADTQIRNWKPSAPDR